MNIKQYILLFGLLVAVQAYGDATSDQQGATAEIVPVFSQKGGMLRPGDQSIYFRTDDEWTGFSTVFLGYRYGLTDYFNIGTEVGASLIPHVYLADILLHFKVYESPGKRFFSGVRVRLGYKYQDQDLGYLGFGDKYLVIVNRHSLYFAADLTAAVRFGRWKEQVLYYTIYPKVDFNLVDRSSTYVLFAPINVGYEIQFGKHREWSFAVESGYAFPLPWGSVPEGEWVNFPSLANVGLHYRFINPKN